VKSISKRTETFYTIELSQNQIITLVTALGLTSPEERRSEALNFFQVENFEDDNILFDSLAELVSLQEKYSEKTPEMSKMACTLA
jgi:hypothetical protein